MTDKITIDINSLKKAIREVNSESSGGFDSKTHALHHQYIQMEIDRRQRRIALSEKIKAQIIGWSIISVISGILALIGKAAYDIMRIDK